jgi:hypothetical protein
VIPYFPDELAEAFTAYIGTLTPTASYQRESGDTWSEAILPLLPELEPGDSDLRHLRYYVECRSGQSIGAECAGPAAVISTQLTVRCLFEVGQLAASDADWRRAERGIAVLWMHLYDHRRSGYPVGVSPVTAAGSAGYSVQPSGVSGWYIGTITIPMIHQMPAEA